MDANDAPPAGRSPELPAPLSTLADQTPKDRQSLIGIVVACGVGVVALLVSYLLAATYQWQEGFIEVALQQVDGVTLAQPPSGIDLVPTGTLTATVAADALPGGAVALVWVADGLQTVLWCAVVVMLALIARNLSDGRVFAPVTLRLVNAFTIVVFAVAAGPQILRHMGTNWVIAALGWEGHRAPNPDSGSAVWIAYAAMLFCVCMQVALRSGARLARDQDGII